MWSIWVLGDISSTAEDVARWDVALATSALLDPKWWHNMVSTRFAVDEPSDIPALSVEGYALAWFTANLLGHRVAVHTGDNSGFGSLNLVVWDLPIRVVVLSNEQCTDVMEVAVELLEPLLG
jgi:CubicO group peptidase (beta-lactamase class C family)